MQSQVRNIKNCLKIFIKRLLGAICYYSGSVHALRAVYNLIGKKLTIVTYHRVIDNPVNSIKHSLPFLFTSVETFEKHIEFYKKHYKILNFRELRHYKNARELPENSLIITFDDGYEDNFTRVFPIMRKHNVPWTLFLATDMVNGGGVPWWDLIFAKLKAIQEKRTFNKFASIDPSFSQIYLLFGDSPSRAFSVLNSWKDHQIKELVEYLKNIETDYDKLILSENSFVNWDQISKMKDEVDFGGHSCSHISLSMIANEEDLIAEVHGCKMEIENRLGREIVAFSYPAGHNNEKVRLVVADAGYLYATTQVKGINSLANRYRLRRINVWEGTSSPGRDYGFSKSFFSLKLLGF